MDAGPACCICTRRESRLLCPHCTEAKLDFERVAWLRQEVRKERALAAARLRAERARNAARGAVVDAVAMVKEREGWAELKRLTSEVHQKRLAVAERRYALEQRAEALRAAAAEAARQAGDNARLASAVASGLEWHLERSRRVLEGVRAARAAKLLSAFGVEAYRRSTSGNDDVGFALLGLPLPWVRGHDSWVSPQACFEIPEGGGHQRPTRLLSSHRMQMPRSRIRGAREDDR